MDLSNDDVQHFAEADRREVDPPIKVEVATWLKAGQLDWWVKERQEWWGRVRGADDRQRWIRAVDLRPASSLTAMTPAECGAALGTGPWSIRIGTSTRRWLDEDGVPYTTLWALRPFTSESLVD